MFSRLIVIFIVLWIGIVPLIGQDDTDDSALPTIAYGEVISGRIDNFTPSEAYSFEALRGDFIEVRLRPTGGNLDPVLTVLDPNGRAIVSRDDTRGTLEAYEDALLIQESGIYTIIVARFGYGLGSTVGEYELTVERIGNSSASGSALRYADTVLNTISNSDPEYFYSFRANEGDIVNIVMERRSGDLDPKLQIVHIVEGQALVLAENDDAPGVLDARIEALIIPATGTYYIIATRFGQEAGPSTGNFILTLEETANSGLANTPQTARTIRPGVVVENEITDDNYERFYRFEAQRDDIITIRMEQESGTLDTYITLTNAGLVPLTFDDDSGAGRNSLIQDFIIPANGTYYIIATRFEGEAGTSRGEFTLDMESGGNVFAGVLARAQRIDYNLSVTGSIDDVTDEGLFVFFGQEGDVITVTMNRGDGDLDPVLTLLDRASRELIRDDDGGNDLNARIEQYTLPETGIYYIRTERFEGIGEQLTSGSYVLVLALVRQQEDAETPVP